MGSAWFPCDVAVAPKCGLGMEEEEEDGSEAYIEAGLATRFGLDGNELAGCAAGLAGVSSRLGSAEYEGCLNVCILVVGVH